MAGSSRAEAGAGGIDGPAAAGAASAYANGQRGGHAHASSSLERSGGARESSEGRGQPRNAGGSQGEALPLAQCLALEPIVLGEQKPSRTVELRRVLGVTVEEQSFGVVQTKPLPSIASEELRRIRASLAESSARARERGKSLMDCLHKLDKYMSIGSWKRQRSGISTEKAGGSNVSRVGTQANRGCAEILGQRQDERNKSAGTSKRARSSLSDARLEGRGNVPVRQGPSVDNEKSSLSEKEKSSVRTTSKVPGPSVDNEKSSLLEKEKSSVRTTSKVLGPPDDKLRGLSPGGEGWGKIKKLKRKRSVGTMLNRGTDGECNVKPTLQHRTNNDAHVRSSDGPSLRAHTSEDVQAGSSSPSTKGKACRAPRTSSVVVMNSSSSLQRSSGGSDEWEEASCTNKVSSLGGTANRKRPMPPSASSPPVAWVGQRPPKMSRTRRANVVSPVSNFDEAPVLSEGLPLDVAARSAPAESCGHRGVSTNNLQTVSKMDSVSSPLGLSESEGSAAIESKTKEKLTNSAEVENGFGNTVHNSTDLIFSSNKSRLPLKEELADGSVRRQGRSGRGTMHVKACSVSKEKLETPKPTKPFKSGKAGFEKNDSKVGRPPTKKGSDRKASSRHVSILNCGSTDATGQSDDDQEELLAAATATRNAIVAAYSGSFWKIMEPTLTSNSSEDLSFLQHQIAFVEELEMSMSGMLDSEDNRIVSSSCSGPPTKAELSSQVLSSANSSIILEQCKTNGLGPEKSVGISSSVDNTQGTASRKIEMDRWIDKMAPLTHRLLSAFMEEGNEIFECNNIQGDLLLEFSNDFIPYITKRHLENGREASAVNSNFGSGLDFKHSNNRSIHNSPCNGFTASSNLRSSSIQSSIYGENLSAGSNFAARHPNDSPLDELMPNISRQYQNLAKSLSLTPSECQYSNMSLDDRILIELHSVDIYPEIVPKLDEGEDESIDKAISELNMRLYEQAKQKKCHLRNLEKAIQDTKSVEERSLEQHAMNKLVEMAYRKQLGGRGGSSNKGGISKAAKQAASAFAKRTLARCQKFEETGESCFRDPSLWSVLSAPLPSSHSKLVEGASAKSGIGERSKLQKLDGSLYDHGGTKWKKSEREREQHRDSSTSNMKSGRHSTSGGRIERKTKTRTKQKISQLSTSGNVLGRIIESSDFSTPSTRESCVRTDRQGRHSSANIAQGSSNAALTNLSGLDSIDILDVAEELHGGHDIDAWFGLDDDSLQDLDLVGLEIPDDDLSQLGFCLK